MNDSENEQIYDPNFSWYAETSSSGDINPMSYHLTAFELINQLKSLHFILAQSENSVIVIPSLKRKIFQKDLKSTFPSSVVL